MPEEKSVNWFKIGLIVQSVFGLVLIFIFIYKPAQKSQPDYTYVKLLEIPTNEWFQKFGFSTDSQFAFNIFMNRRILTSHYNKIMDINQRLKVLEKALKPIENPTELKTDKAIDDSNEVIQK